MKIFVLVGDKPRHPRYPIPRRQLIVGSHVALLERSFCIAMYASWRNSHVFFELDYIHPSQLYGKYTVQVYGDKAGMEMGDYIHLSRLYGKYSAQVYTAKKLVYGGELETQPPDVKGRGGGSLGEIVIQLLYSKTLESRVSPDVEKG